MNERLKTAYIETLRSHPENSKEFWADWLDPEKKKAKSREKLSGLFLPSVSDQYETSKTKIMLVGAETAGWYPLLKRNEDGQALTENGKIAKPKHQRGQTDLPAASLSYQSLEDYIDKTMVRHSQVLGKGMKSPNTKGRTFYNYLRGLNKELSQIGAGYDSGGWVWCNLHCFDWDGKSPIRKTADYEKFIKPLSKKLLNLQIDILKPDFIVFLSGISAAKNRNEFLQNAQNEKRYAGLPNQNHPRETKYLWEFKLDDHIHCIRTHHPSARSPEAQRALTESKYLLRRLIEMRPPIAQA